MSLEKTRSMEAGLQTILIDQPPEPKEKLSLCKKIRVICTNITVEPIMVLYLLPGVMASLATQNLNLEKACRVNLGYDPVVCDALSARNASAYNKTDEEEVQRLVATMNAWKNVIQSIFPPLLLLFLGSWSDRHQRRKPCIIAPIIGDLVTTAGFLLCTFFFFELPVEASTLFEAVPQALTGGWFSMFLGIFSYISAVSTFEQRTIRIGAVNMFANVSMTIGIALSGVLYKTIGFYGVFMLSFCMSSLGLIYAWVFVKEVPQKGESHCVEGSKIKDFFDWKHISETFKVAFKEGAKNRRRRICTIMVLIMVVIGPMHGEYNVEYLFVRYRFGWNEIDYSIYSTFHMIATSVGTIVSLTLFTKFLKVDDAVLGMISSTSKICACIVNALAPSSAYFYLGSLVEILNGTSFIAMRSIISKLVPSDELGKINSLFGVSEALMPLVYGPLYSTVYKKTLKVLPGAFYLLGGALTLPAVFIFLWLYKEALNDRRENEMEKAQQEVLLEKKI